MITRDSLKDAKKLGDESFRDRGASRARDESKTPRKSAWNLEEKEFRPHADSNTRSTRDGAGVPCNYLHDRTEKISR